MKKWHSRKVHPILANSSAFHETRRSFTNLSIYPNFTRISFFSRNLLESFFNFNFSRSFHELFVHFLFYEVFTQNSFVRRPSKLVSHVKLVRPQNIAKLALARKSSPSAKRVRKARLHIYLVRETHRAQNSFNSKTHPEITPTRRTRPNFGLRVGLYVQVFPFLSQIERNTL